LPEAEELVDTAAMTFARLQSASPFKNGCFHVVIRSARRAFLCGPI